MLLLYKKKLFAMSQFTRVFSYGSNSTAQLRARVQALHLHSDPAIVYDWVRIFCMKSTNWGGAVASLVPKKGGMVRGAVVTLNAAQLELLDGFERGYVKARVSATMETPGSSSTKEEVIAYIAKDVAWTEMPRCNPAICFVHVLSTDRSRLILALVVVSRTSPPSISCCANTGTLANPSRYLAARVSRKRRLRRWRQRVVQVRRTTHL
jgi:gamma-glutamylcyclotransferase (GGCT)/AIG2-like uncharacterized protein YtfP